MLKSLEILQCFDQCQRYCLTYFVLFLKKVLGTGITGKHNGRILMMFNLKYIYSLIKIYWFWWNISIFFIKMTLGSVPIFFNYTYTTNLVIETLQCWPNEQWSQQWNCTLIMNLDICIYKSITTQTHSDTFFFFNANKNCLL